MRPRSIHRRALFASALLLPLVSAVNLDCKTILANGVAFSFEELGGPHTVSFAQEHDPGVKNTTYTVDLCNGLTPPTGTKSSEYCGKGTRVCGISELTKPDNEPVVDEVREIARGYEHDAAHLDPKFTLLSTSPSNADAEREGLRIEIGGGKYPSRSGKKQKAIIEMLCKHDDGQGGDTEKRELWRDDEGEEDGSEKEEGDGDDDGGDGEENPSDKWKGQKTTDDGHGGTLHFISWSESSEREDILRLEWNTKYACEDFAGSPANRSSGGWGFFSWLFFLLFLGLVGYFGFFAWVNYSKYGAHGWDLLPHADAIRDAPYILADWGRKVASTFSGGGGRGGYSAV